MAQRTLISDAPGLKTELVSDNSDTRLHIVTTQEDWQVKQEVAQRKREWAEQSKTHDGNNKPVAVIPAAIVNDLVQKGIWQDPDAFDRWFRVWANNPENADLRITEGRV